MHEGTRAMTMRLTPVNRREKVAVLMQGMVVVVMAMRPACLCSETRMLSRGQAA
jgi:hypothetical protein